VASAFRSFGHEVDTFNYRAFHLHRFGGGRSLLARLLLRKVASYKPDFVFVTKGESIAKGTIQRITRQGIVTAAWTMDSPFGKENSQNTLQNIDEYTHFFVFDASYLPALRRINANSHLLPCCVDPELHCEVIPYAQRTWPYALGFVGSQYPNRQEFLSHFTSLDLHIWGHRWEEQTRKTSLHAHIEPERLFADRNERDLARTCEIWNSTRINLNPHFPHSKLHPNLRVFELLATNSFQLTDNLQGLSDMFELGKELVTYSSVTECQEKIKYYLEHPQEMYKITAAGRKRVLRDHTYRNRMGDVLKIIQSPRR